MTFPDRCGIVHTSIHSGLGLGALHEKEAGRCAIGITFHHHWAIGKWGNRYLAIES